MNKFFAQLKKHLLGIEVSIAIAFLVVCAALAVLFYNGVFGPHYLLAKTSFVGLPHWSSDDHRQAFAAFQNSCTEIRKRNPSQMFSSLPQARGVKDWQVICQAADKLKNPDEQTARKFFETWFEPYHLSNHLNSGVLFTGYYLPVLNGSLMTSKVYTIPIYAIPSDMIKVKLALFGSQFKGKKQLIGMLKDKTVYPYHDRKAINEGAIKNKAKVLVWGNSIVDVFFAQIQGSALVKLPDNKQLLIGFASDNGRKYTSIGKVLMVKKEFQKKSVSMQNIRAWLSQHPDEVNDILNKDESYVFFRILKTASPLGSEGVELTPGRSLAVDRERIPLGVPVWLNTSIPGKNKTTLPFNRLMVAQDTGGAIKNMHGDIYLGSGEEAAFVAGNLKNSGQWWLLLPRGDVQTPP